MAAFISIRHHASGFFHTKCLAYERSRTESSIPIFFLPVALLAVGMFYLRDPMDYWTGIGPCHGPLEANFYIVLFPLLCLFQLLLGEIILFKGSFESLKGIDMVKSWPGPGQKYNLLYSTA